MPGFVAQELERKRTVEEVLVQQQERQIVDLRKAWQKMIRENPKEARAIDRYCEGYIASHNELIGRLHKSLPEFVGKKVDAAAMKHDVHLAAAEENRVEQERVERVVKSSEAVGAHVARFSLGW